MQKCTGLQFVKSAASEVIVILDNELILEIVFVSRIRIRDSEFNIIYANLKAQRRGNLRSISGRRDRQS